MDSSPVFLSLSNRLDTLSVLEVELCELDLYELNESNEVMAFLLFTKLLTR